MISEFKLSTKDWPSVLGLVQSALNEAPLSILGKNADGSLRTPLQVMTGIMPRRSIMSIIPDGRPGVSAISIERARVEQLISIDSIQDALNLMHKDVGGRVTKRRQKELEKFNRSTKLVQPNFSVGDYFLVRRPDDSGKKPKFKWTGPRRIVGAVHPLLFLVEYLLTKKTERVHCAGMLKYDGLKDGDTVPESVLDLVNISNVQYEVLEQIVDIGKEDDTIWLKLQWEGLPDERDFTWGKLSDLFTDVPDMVNFSPSVRIAT